MKNDTVEQFLNDYKKIVTPDVVINFLKTYFDITYPTKFCDNFVADSFDKDNSMTITMILHGQFFADKVTVYPFDIKTTISASHKIVVAWRKYLNSIIPNYKQAYKQFFLQKQEQKIDEELLEF